MRTYRFSVADQLITRGIDVITVRELGTLGHNDERHLMIATSSGRVLCTHDMDFIRLAMDGRNMLESLLHLDAGLGSGIG